MNKSRGASEDVFFNIRMKPEMHAVLAELAEQNERTIAAEIRLAVKEHLRRQARSKGGA